MKALSVLARKVWRVSVGRDLMRASEGMERRWESFSAAGRVRGMECAVQSSLNWTVRFDEVVGAGWIATALDQRYTRLMSRWDAGRWASW